MDALTHIPAEKLSAATTYAEYHAHVQELVLQNSTTGSIKSPALAEYTSLNLTRKERVAKTFKLEPEIEEAIATIGKPLHWLVFTESWCGDAAQTVPVMAAIADTSHKINMSVLLRDEHPELFEHFLTNGSQSIPVLVCLDEKSGRILGTWGPRPAPAQTMVMEAKAEGGTAYAEIAQQVQSWYNKDRSKTTQAELADMIRQWSVMAKA